MANPAKKHTKRLTISAMLAALGVVIMALGSLIEALDLTTAALASMLCIYAVIELGRGYPWMIWAVTSLLSLLLLPYPKTPALFYLLMGFYPILKERMEALPRWVCFLWKLVVIHVMLGLVYLAFWLFPELRAFLQKGWLLLAAYAFSLFVFLLYDYALTKIISFYLFKLHPHLRLK